MKAQIQFITQNQDCTITCSGTWDAFKLKNIISELELLNIKQFNKFQNIYICGANIEKLDSAGAIVLIELNNKFKNFNYTIKFINFSKLYLELLTRLENQNNDIIQDNNTLKINLLNAIGKEANNKLQQANGFFNLVGKLSGDCVDIIKKPKGFHVDYVISNIYSTGIKALPIVGLLSFLIGIVLAYQMGLQLKIYGANILIAFLSGMAIFREFAPLITAIIVAGRTSSSFTAQIGSMKINEEIDAINTMGLSPTKLLVVPKLLGLLIAFPLLIFWSNIFSILGAMFMSNNMLNVGFIDFLMRLKTSVGLKQLLLGLYKAPAFALIIALVGCFQGFEVEASGKKNIGYQTTKSVVQALFLIIIADAAFSVIYSWMDL